jgi:hypothetical protein
MISVSLLGWVLVVTATIIFIYVMFFGGLEVKLEVEHRKVKLSKIWSSLLKFFIAIVIIIPSLTIGFSLIRAHSQISLVLLIVAGIIVTYILKLWLRALHSDCMSKTKKIFVLLMMIIRSSVENATSFLVIIGLLKLLTIIR